MVSDSVMETRPDKFGLLKVKSLGYRAVQSPAGEMFLQAVDVVGVVEWFELHH
jgi:hypothetical protein